MTNTKQIVTRMYSWIIFLPQTAVDLYIWKKLNLSYIFGIHNQEKLLGNKI